MKVFLILMCCLVSNVVSVQEKRSMESSQNGKSNPLLWLIFNRLDRLETKINTSFLQSSQNGKSSPLLLLIFNQLYRLETNRNKKQDKAEVRQKQITEINTRIDKIQKENKERQKQHSDINAKISALHNDVRKLKDKCENGWKSYGNHCYLFGFNKIIWHDAKKECERRHSHLVKIDSSAENSWLGSEFLTTGNNFDALWIGANDLIKEGKWAWISDHSTIGYSNWKTGQPNNFGGKEECGEIYKQHSFTWNDAPCSEKHGYICEK